MTERRLLRFDAGRRGFVKGLAVAGGALSGLSGVSAVVVADAGKPAPEAPRPVGYRETAHVREYYQKARL